MERPYITQGSYTTAGGIVVSASSRKFIDGVCVAVEGDCITCRRCKSTGYIFCIGPRIPDYCDGKAIALERDLCICRCVPSPQLIASQRRVFQTIKESSVVSTASHASVSDTNKQEQAAKNFDMHFKIVSEKSGEPKANTGYKITLEDGTEIKGLTDENGFTEKISATYAALATITAPYYDDHPTNQIDSDHGCDTCGCEDSGEGAKRGLLGRALSRLDFSR